MYVYVYVCVCVYVCMYACMHACMHVCEFVRVYVIRLIPCSPINNGLLHVVSNIMLVIQL